MQFDVTFFAAMVPAVILMGLSKGGFAGLGLLALPLMTFVVPPVQAAAIMLPLLIAQDVVTVWSYRRDFDGRTLATLMPGAVAGIFAGWALAAYVSDAAVLLSVGLISAAFAGRRILRHRAAPPAARTPSHARGGFWGAVTGFTSMIAHAGGPPFQIYVMPLRLRPAAFVGTGALLFAAINWVKVVPYMALGQFSPDNLLASAALFPVAVAATLLGVWLVRRIPAERFYVLIDWLLLAIGCKLCFDGLRGLGLA